MPDLKDCWDLSGRDVVPDLGSLGRPADPGAAILQALLSADGVDWAPPYDNFRSVLGVRAKPIEPEREEQSSQRLRTWLVFFRSLGLVLEDAGKLRVTPLGTRVRELIDEQYSAVADFGRELNRSQRWRLARLLVGPLARYQLRNPFTANEYPADTDIHPLWAIWKAMRELDDKIHWDELDRTLTLCLRGDQVADAMARIRAARETADYDPNDAILLEGLLGPRKPVASSQQDRVITWLSRAAFKDLFLEHRNRADGYRHLQQEFAPLIDEALAHEPDDFAGSDPAGYVEWLGAVAEPEARGSSMSSEIVGRVVDRCRRYGERQLITLVGPAGTGKTTAAKEAALVLVDGDETRLSVVQFHAAFTYEEFIGGLAPDSAGGFVPTPGALVRVNDRALADPDLQFVMVIDELSRADTANVLGEFLTYVEYRGQPFHVPALGRDIRLARNLIVIGTMNPADRSVVNMDDALVRRLRQVALPPDVVALTTILDSAGMAAGLRDQVAGWFETLPRDVPFGHGLFVDVADEQDLYNLWHEKLVFFLRRGGLVVYRDPEAIEEGFIWRREEFAKPSDASALEPAEAIVNTPETALPPQA